LSIRKRQYLFPIPGHVDLGVREERETRQDFRRVVVVDVDLHEPNPTPNPLIILITTVNAING
jgi:hypothetical protein